MVDNQARLKRKGVAFHNPAGLIARLPIDHGVGPVDLQGGAGAAEARLSSFVDSRLASYATERNRPELDATSGLSPYLHFGHVSAHEILACIADREGWTRDDLADDARGHRAGWWGMTESSEAFLDQLVTWRELGFNRCLQVEGYDRYEALPAWARETLAEHASDPREVIYGLDDFEFARTHDPLWNAAQNQLRREGRIHNYLRMLWGKKILEFGEYGAEVPGARVCRTVFGWVRGWGSDRNEGQADLSLKSTWMASARFSAGFPASIPVRMFRAFSMCLIASALENRASGS